MYLGDLWLILQGNSLLFTLGTFLTGIGLWWDLFSVWIFFHLYWNLTLFMINGFSNISPSVDRLPLDGVPISTSSWLILAKARGPSRCFGWKAMLMLEWCVEDTCCWTFWTNNRLLWCCCCSWLLTCDGGSCAPASNECRDAEKASCFGLRLW